MNDDTVSAATRPGTAVGRAFGALPDALTAATFALAWIAPAMLGPDYVACLSQILLIEFIVVHSSAFYAGIVGAPGIARGKRVALLAALSSLYVLFVLGFSLAYHSTWPILAFGWLLGSRFVQVWTRPVPDDAVIGRMVKLWAVSVAAYVLGAMATIMLPLPALGMTGEFVASMHQAGRGQWHDRPQSLLAFGLLYFAIQAWAKYSLGGSSGAAANTARGDGRSEPGRATERT